MTMITQREFEEKMREICENPHSYYEANTLMCEVLLQFGYDVGVKIFMSKMYGVNFKDPDSEGENT